MTANELMIGDWVNYNSLNQRIEEITDVDNQVYVSGDGVVDIPELNPIPLTREILEKNGFEGDREVQQFHFEENGEKYHFSLRQMYDKDDIPRGYSFFAFNVLTILDYVHQLQHALRLCEINKEIEL